MRTIPINEWERSEEYNHFGTFADPFFDVTANINVTNLRRRTRAKHISFYGSLIFVTMKAINSLEDFLCRIEGKNVVYYDAAEPFFVDIDDKTHKIKFVTYPMEENLVSFARGAMETAKAKKTLQCSEEEQKLPCKVFISCMPWITLLSYHSARRGDKNDFTPDVLWSRYYEADDGELLIPCTITLNHRAHDAYHTSLFFALLQKIIDEVS